MFLLLKRREPREVLEPHRLGFSFPAVGDEVGGQDYQPQPGAVLEQDDLRVVVAKVHDLLPTPVRAKCAVGRGGQERGRGRGAA